MDRCLIERLSVHLRSRGRYERGCAVDRGVLVGCAHFGFIDLAWYAARPTIRWGRRRFYAWVRPP